MPILLQRRALLHAAVGAMLTPACSGSTGKPRERAVVVRGSDTMTVLLRRWALAYTSSGVDVSGGGTGTGIAALANGTADVAAASRRMTEAERQRMEATVGVTEEVIVAIDAVAVYVHARSALTSITMGELSRIYRGRIGGWNELHAGDHAIARYSRENSSGTYAFFRERVLHGSVMAPDVQCLPGTAAVVRAVALDRWAIGYGGIASVAASPIRVLPIRDAQGKLAPPDREAVNAGAYPLARPVYVYFARDARAEVRAFAHWMRSVEAQRLAVDAGFFPVEGSS